MVQVRPDGALAPGAAGLQTAATGALPAALASIAAVPAQRGIHSPDSAVDVACLDLHEGIDGLFGQTGCRRWPSALRLRNEQTGELVLGRCRSTNLCPYCQRLYVVETVEMLTLDAMEYAPTLWLVLTAREHLTRADCRRHLDAVLRSVRRKFPAVEWFVQVEFQRRGALHLNLLVKGVEGGDLHALHEQVVKIWCKRVDALPVGQWAGVVEDAGGVVKYLSKMLAHGLKAEQAPPIGWRGHRTSQTKGYLVRPASAMRKQARESLKLKRELWKAIEAGHDPHDAELIARENLELAARSTWVLATDRGARLSSVAHDPRRMVPLGGGVDWPQLAGRIWDRKAGEAVEAFRDHLKSAWLADPAAWQSYAAEGL